MIIFGPLLTPTQKFEIFHPDFVHSGFELEFTINGAHHLLAIFQNVSHGRGDRPEFNDYYVLGNENGWPFKFPHRNHHVAGRNLIQMSPVVRALIQDLAGEQSFTGFFGEFREKLRVIVYAEVYEPTIPIHLIPELEQAGYFVSGVIHYGRQLAVELSWRFPDDSKEWDRIHSGRMTFSLSEGELRSAKWAPHHWPENVENLFWCRLREIAPRDPQQIFNSVADLSALSTLVDWHPTISLSANELRARRDDYVALHRKFWNSPVELARMMIAERLYAQSTSPHQIAIGLQKKISELAPRTR